MAYVILSPNSMAVIGVFANPQPGNASVVTIDDDDPRLLAFLNPPPTPYQQYEQQLSSGIVLTSTGTSTLSGTYTVPVPNGPAQNAAAQANITAIETSIAAGRGLPGGGATFNYYDSSGAPHSFNATNWGNFATAVMNYSYTLQGWYLGGCSGSPPSNALTIA
jgi:hypothetical protein